MSVNPTFSEQLAKRILARAIELDHIKGANYSLSELRGIAAEVGVSDSALEQAMRELTPASSDVPAGSVGRLRIMGVAAVATTVGAVSGIVDTTTFFVTGPLAMGVLLMLSGGLAVMEDHRSPSRGFLRFQLKNVLLWGVHFVTWGVAATAASGGAGQLHTTIMGRVVILGWAVSAVFGTFVSMIQSWRARSRADKESIETPWKTRVADTLKSWIDQWAMRVDLQGAATTVKTGPAKT